MTGENSLTKKERIAVLVYFPVHIVLLPLLLGVLVLREKLDEATANFLIYAVGTLYMFLLLGRFLRREFDPFCDRIGRCALQIGGSYLAIIAFNSLFVLLLYLISGDTEIMNPNNEVIIGMATDRPGMIKAMGVFLAPIVEELLFRAGLFGSLRRKNRTAAYIVSILAFSLYHVGAYLLLDLRYLFFVLQYLPASWLLARSYEKSGSIWTSIFLHMLINAVSLAGIEGLASL